MNGYHSSSLFKKQCTNYHFWIRMSDWNAVFRCSLPYPTNMLVCARYETFAIHHSELFLCNLCIWESTIKVRYRQLHRLGYCVFIWSITALFLVPTRHECWSSNLSDHNRFTLAYHIIWTIKHINFPPQYYWFTNLYIT